MVVFIRARLVDQLRTEGDIEIALIAVDDGAIVGYLALSKMRAPFRALGLGPAAVSPHYRHRGVAARLIRRALAKAKESGWDGVFLLGDPANYQRFGFKQDVAAGFQTIFAGPHFMALALQGDDLPVNSGPISYAPAFDDLQ